MVSGVVSVSGGRPATVSWVEHRSCRSKVTHFSGREARAAANDMMNKHGGGRLAAYHCRFCDGWHVGHPTPRR